jgi:penicillin-binding protein 2
MRNHYSGRKYLLTGLFLIVGVAFVLRLFFLQVVDKSYRLSASNNVLRYHPQYPARGLIYDRNGELLVYNEAAYDLMVVPHQVQNIDTAELCRIIGIDKLTFERNLKRARAHSRYRPSVFETQISKETHALLDERLFKYPGFYFQTRTLRNYPTFTAAHTLGYIGEVSQRIIDNNPYYKMGDYIGISGIESTYEEILRGEKGLKVVMVDVHNREVGSYLEGRFDTTAVMGTDLHLTIDVNLQTYGELLMQNKRGSIVAIEPSTGEILALVTSPAYDPNLMVGRSRTINYRRLSQDTLKPIFNRALMATYPPGSTFKVVNALVCLQHGAITPASQYACYGPETRPIRCSHNHKSPIKLCDAIEHSCNPYFWGSFRDLIESPRFGDASSAFTQWVDDVQSFGLGKSFNSDLFGQQTGKIPLPGEYNRIYGVNRWRALTIRSLSIGQGEILLTPLQMANTAAIIANRGYFYPPHLLKAMGDSSNMKPLELERTNTNIDQRHYEEVVQGMHQVFTGEHGTARWYRLDDIPMCGKTGTAENPHGKDHSLFIAFAPKDQPKIALAVVVENAGFGATWAVPIATLMMEKYLKGEVSRKHVEERMINAIIN